MKLQESAIGDFTRGGQTTLLFIRMIGEVVHKFAGITVIVYSVVTLTLFWHRTENYERYLAVKYVAGLAMTDWMEHGTTVTTIDNPDKSTVQVTFADLDHAPALKNNARTLLFTWFGCMAVSFTCVLTILALIFVTVFKFGKSQRMETLIRGSNILEADQLTDLLKKEKIASPLTLGNIPLRKDSETSHVLMTGSPGTGKSTLIWQLLKQIRDRGDRCICYSPSGDFIEWFYREKKDVLLNPFDARCPPWSLWDECTDDYHYDMLSAAIIPEPKAGDPFWSNSARIVLSTLMQRTERPSERDTRRLLELLSETDLDDLQSFVQGTEAYALLSPKAEKTSQGIRTTASTYARSLKYLPRGEKPFHLRDWVLSDKSDQWVFLNAHSDQREAARPLLSAWLEVFTNTILSLPASRTRRIWLVIDELPSLHKLPSLNDFLAQSRKFGGCGVIAFQQISQLRESYGKDGADSLTGLCTTWMCLRQNDPPTAKWSSESFGESEYLEQSEGLSYGSHEMRDGISLSQQRKMRPVILPSEIRNLNDLEGFIRLPGKIGSGQSAKAIPIGHFQIQRRAIKKLAEAFKRRADTPADADMEAPLEDLPNNPVPIEILTGIAPQSAPIDVVEAASTTTADEKPNYLTDSFTRKTGRAKETSNAVD